MSKKSKIIFLVAVSLCVLLLIGSIVCTALLFTGYIVVNNKQDIVANARVIDGVDYPSVDYSLLPLLLSSEDVAVGEVLGPNGYGYKSYFLGSSGELEFAPLDSYYFTFENGALDAYGYFVATDDYNVIFDNFYVVSIFSIFDSLGELSNSSIVAYIVFNYLDNEYFLLLDDSLNEVGQSNAYIYIYSFEFSQSSNTVDNIGSIIASGMTFGLDGITSSVSTAFDSVFLDSDGNLSNYSIFVFWALGVSVALGFFKYILDWILSLGSRK